MMLEWIDVMNKQVRGNGEWFDAFGCLYEAIIASKSRRQNNAQFFTPECLCDLMVQLKGDKEGMTGKGYKISDPTCGSGRGLLAFHAYAPGNLMYGEDIDKTCAMMTVCNFLIHGVDGEVIWHNSLDPESYYGGWRTNRMLKYVKLPFIEHWPAERSFVIQSWKAKRLMHEANKKEEEEKIIKLKPVQLNLFE